MAALGLELGSNDKEFAACPAYRAVWDFLDSDEMWEAVIFREALYDWNDARGRTQEDVIAVLRAAAAVERVKESVYSTEDQPLPEFEEVA